MPLFRKRRDDEPVDMNGRSPRLGVRYKGLAVLDQLVKNGADLSESRHVIYYSYAPSEETAHGDAARRCDERLRSVRPGATSQLPWSVGHDLRDPRCYFAWLRA